MRPDRRRFLLAAASAPLAGPAAALPWSPSPERVNRQLAGTVLDFTRNHGADRRIESAALGAKRDLYVYLPPGYDGRACFPALVWLHAVRQNETFFLELIPTLDRAIRDGKLPPMIVAAPDGTIRGRGLADTGSFYLPGVRGDFDRYITEDVWGFTKANYRVMPGRDHHILAGASMGGFGAFNLGLRNREEFGQLVGIMPPLNLRYGDCLGRYFSEFDPNCYTLRDVDRRWEVVGRFYGGLLRVRNKHLLTPVIGRRGINATDFISEHNPAELLDRLDVRPGEFGLFAGYGTADEFNIGAQVESFAATAARRGVAVDTDRVPGGKHNSDTAYALFPAFCRWLSARLADAR